MTWNQNRFSAFGFTTGIATCWWWTWTQSYRILRWNTRVYHRLWTNSSESASFPKTKKYDRWIQGLLLCYYIYSLDFLNELMQWNLMFLLLNDGIRRLLQIRWLMMKKTTGDFLFIKDFYWKSWIRGKWKENLFVKPNGRIKRLQRAPQKYFKF